MGRMGRVPRTECWALLCGLASCASQEDGAQPPFELQLPIERLRLDNGLEVVVAPNHTAPLVTALVAVRAGSAVEDTSTNGYSHLFEHMIFQGSEAVPDTLAFRERLDTLGVSSNAITSVDHVSYFFTATRDAFEPALELFAGAIIAPKLDPALLEKEKQVVLGEFDLNESDTDFLRYRSTLSLLYGGYATQLDPLGSRAAVLAASHEQLQAMHAKYYVPNNALLVLSGDVTGAEAAELADRYFSPWPAAEDPLRADPPPLPESAEDNRYLVMPAPVTFSRIEVWWQGPSLLDDSRAALAGDLLSDITLQTDHSFRALVGGGTFAAGLGVAVLRRTSYVRVRLSVEPGNEAAALRALDAEIGKLAKRGDISAAQLQEAQQEEFRSFLLTSTSPSSLPHAIAGGWALSDSRRYLGWVDRLYGADDGLLEQFVAQYVRGRPRTVVLMSSPENLQAARIDEEWLRGVAE
jgi:zinc protease